MDTPVAKKSGGSANGSFIELSTASGVLPHTAEKLTPPFSITFPSAITRVIPPPPPFRCQLSLINFPFPSACSSCEQMLSCSSRNQSRISSFLSIVDQISYIKREIQFPHCK